MPVVTPVLPDPRGSVIVGKVEIERFKERGNLIDRGQSILIL